MIGGRFMLTSFASWTDPSAEDAIPGAIAAEYDFEAEKPIGYQLIDMGAEYARYFG